GVDDDGSNGWTASWDTTTVPDGSYQLTVVATFAGSETITSDVRNVTVENALPPEPDPPAGTFQTGRTNDTTGQYLTFPFELEDEGGGGPPGGSQPSFESSMTAEISNVVIYAGGTPNSGVIGGDAIEFDI